MVAVRLAAHKLLAGQRRSSILPANMVRGIWRGVAFCLTGCVYANPAFDVGDASGGGAGSGGASTGGDSTGSPTSGASSGDGGSGSTTGGACGDGPDADSDGQPDVCDPCPDDAANDADGDGLCGDADPCPTGVEADADGDGVCDRADVCPGSDDALDGDLDGVADGCDLCPQAPDDDGDGDGVCGDIDNCPMLANEGQADGDGDGRGDACDVCKDPPFADDQADYDGDGIACEADLCQLDGPTPPSYPNAVGPHAEITIVDAKIDGGGNLGVVAPGANISLQYTWKVNFCECPGCYTQAMVGIVGQPPVQCFWNLGVEYNCHGYQDTEVQGFQAPNQAGTYVFRFNRDYQDNWCNPNKELDSPIFAAFCVK
ncbi:MAG: thrombospondin type 3 repeat-containing protein [Nannocystis sp.]|nr:thrombospondin type 3 repeat-containing protein [Nannocystis sp.]MBK9756032.1 thrombospondin type 3 repeat-containing protein [Nannocystis sp.]